MTASAIAHAKRIVLGEPLHEIVRYGGDAIPCTAMAGTPLTVDRQVDLSPDVPLPPSDSYGPVLFASVPDGTCVQNDPVAILAFVMDRGTKLAVIATKTGKIEFVHPGTLTVDSF